MIQTLNISQVRNISSAELPCHGQFNLIHGENGSGKTSILEAIHLLARGRSFRTAHSESLINYEAEELVVFARLESGQRLGLSRNRQQKGQLRLDDRAQNNWDSVVKLLPVLVLDAGAYGLLEGGPGDRRRFMDWGVFHVEPGFLEQWRRFRKALAHRNRLLKSPDPGPQELEAWGQELVVAAEAVDAARARYLLALLPCFHEVYSALAGDRSLDLDLGYERGWDAGRTLAEVLAASREQDRKYRATQHGPQRADLTIRVNRQRAVELMSRGQQKLLVSALKIAQGRLLAAHAGNRSLYLVDDLPAELDSVNRRAVLSYLARLGSQLFITCVDSRELIKDLARLGDMAAFHVERGRIKA